MNSMDGSEDNQMAYSFKSVDNTENPGAVSLEFDSVFQEKSQVNWTMAATQLLIASWLTRKPQFKLMAPREVYHLISGDLREMGFMYNGDQCSVKWRSLKQSYCKNKATAMERCKPSTWMHYQAMADALGDPDPHPDPVPDNVREPSLPEAPDNDNESADAFPVSSPQPHTSNDDRTKITVKSAQNFTVSTKASSHKKRKGDWTDCYDEMREEWQTRREERVRMHEERMELGRRKLSLMEELINVLKHK